MYTYGPLIAKNARSGRLLGGAPVQVTALDGTPLTTAPAGLVTNHEGYLPAFTVDTDQVTVMARPRGGDPLPLHAHEGIQGAAEVAAAIGEAGTGAAGLAVLAASLPADARQALGITVDTSVGTRVFVGGVMVHGDTGRRLIPLQNGTDGTLYLRRVGDIVELYLRDVVQPDPSLPIYTLPQGFWPFYRPLYGLLGRTGPRQLATFDIAPGGALQQGTSHTVALYAQFTFTTTDAWPTTLPGSPS